MFPLNQDTFIEYSGNTANDLYSDGYGYIYMMKEGAGAAAAAVTFCLAKRWITGISKLTPRWRTAVRCLSIRTIMVTRWKTAKMWCTCGRWRRGSPAPVGGRGDREQSRQQCLRLSEPERTLGRPVKPHRLQADHELEHPESDPQDGAVVNLSTALLDAADETDFSAGINALGIAWSWAISMRTIKSTSSIWPG